MNDEYAILYDEIYNGEAPAEPTEPAHTAEPAEPAAPTAPAQLAEPGGPITAQGSPIRINLTMIGAHNAAPAEPSADSPEVSAAVSPAQQFEGGSAASVAETGYGAGRHRPSAPFCDVSFLLIFALGVLAIAAVLSLVMVLLKNRGKPGSCSVCTENANAQCDCESLERHFGDAARESSLRKPQEKAAERAAEKTTGIPQRTKPVCPYARAAKEICRTCVFNPGHEKEG